MEVPQKWPLRLLALLPACVWPMLPVACAPKRPGCFKSKFRSLPPLRHMLRGLYSPWAWPVVFPKNMLKTGWSLLRPDFQTSSAPSRSHQEEVSRLRAAAINKTKWHFFPEKLPLAYTGKPLVKLLVLGHSACMGEKSRQKPRLLLRAVGVGLRSENLGFP